MDSKTIRTNRVFLNIPYDQPFERLYVAYIVGLAQLGLKPFVTLAIPGGEARLDRIFALIQSCRYSLHDLSRVEISRTPPATPRFNMPFELGLAVAWAKVHPKRHTFVAFEAVNRRAQKSLSDMSGTDFNIHDGTPQGVMRELCSAFVNRTRRPDVPTMMRRFAIVEASLPAIIERAGAKIMYEGRVFTELVLAARESVSSAP